MSGFIGKKGIFMTLLSLGLVACGARPSRHRAHDEHRAVHVVIVHGAFGRPDENWIPWLRAKLGSCINGTALYVEAPTFPTPVGQNLDAWLAVLDRHVDANERDVVLVGHSIGATLVLRALERHRRVVIGAVLVSPVSTLLGDATFDGINHTFVEAPFNWKAITTHSPCGVVLHGDNDPYVPLVTAKNVATQTRWPLKVIAQGGHLNAKAGYTHFAELEAEIEKLISMRKSRAIGSCAQF